MTSLMQRRTSRSSKRGLALLAACTFSLATLIAQPAFADHDNDRGARSERDGDSREWRNDHGQSDRGYYERRRYGHRHYEIYSPEPVYRPRYESPGIRLFVPLWDR